MPSGQSRFSDFETGRSGLRSTPPGRADEALRASEERFRALVEHSHDAVTLLKADGTVLYDSPAVTRVLGYTPTERIGCKVFDFVHPEERAAMARGFADFAMRAGAVASSEGRFVHKDGSTRWIEGVRSNLLHEAAIGAVVVNYRDVTERKRAEEERVKLEDQLRQAVKMESVGRLAGGIAHDFNNMLGVILGHTEIALSRITATEPLHVHLQQIQKAAQRSAELTRQLLAFARKQAIAPSVVNLNEAIVGTLRMLQRLIGEHIRLRWHPAANLWPVRVDRSQIDQILANLCLNARDAIAHAGQVVIETANVTLDHEVHGDHAGFARGEFVRLAVSDDGSGMEKETLAHIFEPFFTTKGIGEGTGLGLATVYGAVKQNNGFIDVLSEPGAGTTFRIFLPRHLAGDRDR
ncbi:MAG: PAS domain S-box protein [Candidatus Schekmanbacteria bacterium]|nr:PAS domain S-box protein [Candidatus Schekmanbacteria bacterium]